LKLTAVAIEVAKFQGHLETAKRHNVK